MRSLRKGVNHVLVTCTRFQKALGCNLPQVVFVFFSVSDLKQSSQKTGQNGFQKLSKIYLLLWSNTVLHARIEPVVMHITKKSQLKEWKV